MEILEASIVLNWDGKQKRGDKRVKRERIDLTRTNSAMFALFSS